MSNKIKAIPIGNAEEADYLVWHFTPHGIYSVKSAYDLLKRYEDTSDKPAASCNLKEDREFWRSVWELKAIPRVKNFVWRAINNALPTMENLTKRHRAYTDRCPQCNEIETVEHCLVLCPYAVTVWHTTEFCFKPNPDGFSSFSKWWSEIFTMLKVAKMTEQIAVIANTCRSIWNARNELVWNNKLMNPVEVCKKAREGIMVETRVSSADVEPRAELWKPAIMGMKLNCAASYKERKAGIAVITRDVTGMLIDCFCSFKTCISTRAADAIAVLKAMKLVQRNQWFNTEIASQNHDLIKDLNRNIQNRWDSSATEREIIRLANNTNCKFVYEPKGSNKPASFMAKKARSELFICIDAVFIPEKLITMLQTDLNNVMVM